MYIGELLFLALLKSVKDRVLFDAGLDRGYPFVHILIRVGLEAVVVMVTCVCVCEGGRREGWNKRV